MQTKLLVVGGGFIGMHIADKGLEAGWLVTVIRLTSSVTLIKNDRLTVIQSDITDMVDLKNKVKDTNYDYVVNCGGYIDHTLFFSGGRKMIDSHFSGVLNLVSLLNRERLKSFINLGSSDEYGNIPAPQSENDLEKPISPYSFGKLASTKFLEMLFRTEAFPATTLRLFLVYGPRQEYKRFIPHIIKGCLLGNDIPVSEGMQVRDFLYVDDLVNAIFKVFESPNARGETINLASGNPVTIREIITRVQEKIRNGNPVFGQIPYRIGENMSLYADIEKAKTILNWQPLTSLEDGLSTTIAYYRNQI